MTGGVYKRTAEHSKNISLALMGHPGASKGQHRSEEQKKRMRIAFLKRPKRILTEEHKRNISRGCKGEKAPNWKGGISRHWKYKSNRKWEVLRLKIYKRDNWICQYCGKKCNKIGQIQCHHIIPWLLSHDNHPNNLITLCVSCHSKVDYQFKSLL